MAGPNISFDIRNAPHIAAQLTALPRASRDRQAIEELLEQISRDSLTAVDKWMAIVEQRRSAKIAAGMKAADRRGVHCGRQKAPFDHDHAVVLYLQGRPVRQIATALNVDRDAVARLVQPPRNAGGKCIPFPPRSNS